LTPILGRNFDVGGGDVDYRTHPVACYGFIGVWTLCVSRIGHNRNLFFRPFRIPLFFLFIGSFFIAEALTVHGLDRRFGNWPLSRKWVGSNPIRIMMALSLAVAGMSMWISNTAATAVMLVLSQIMEL